MKRLLSIVILAALVLSITGCAHRVKGRGEASVTFYGEPMSEEQARASGGIWRGGIVFSLAKQLRHHVNAIDKWTDDNSCDREPFTFIGEFMFEESGSVYFFTADGIVYYSHYFGTLSDEGREFLLGLKPAE